MYLLGLATLPALAALTVFVVIMPSVYAWFKAGSRYSGCYLCGKTWRIRKAHSFWHRNVGCRIARGRRSRNAVTDRWGPDERNRRRVEMREALVVLSRTGHSTEGR